jgi:anti-anti-sigma regulatory factor
VTFTVLRSPADSPRGDGTVRFARTVEMDASSPYRLRPAILLDGAGHGAQVAVEPAGVTCMGSCGLEAITVASLALEPCGSGLVLCNVWRQVCRILEITDIGRTAKVRQ